MCYFKKATAMLLAMIMLLSVVLCANAATSPTSAGSSDDNHVVSGNTDLYTAPTGEHVAYDVAGSDAICTAVSANAPKSTALITVAKAADGTIRPVEQIGNGKTGIGNVENGKNVTGVAVVTTSPMLVVATKALSKCYIKNVALDAPKILFQKNVCKGSKVKKVTFNFPNMKKAGQVTVRKNAFKGAKRVTIKVSKQMSKNEFKKLKKKIKKNNKGVKLKFVRN